MYKKLLVVTAILAIAILPSPVQAESEFRNYIMVANMTTHDSKPKVLDFGYDFTLLRYGRFHVFGAGGGLDTWGKWNTGYSDSLKASVFVTGHIVSVALVDPEGYGLTGKYENYATFGLRYIYNTRLKEHRLAAGFAISCK